jgi:anti-anti-sigma factor
MDVPASTRFELDVEPEPAGVRVRPAGEIDLATVESIRRTIDECVADGCDRVVLDLQAVTFLDSTGVHLVLEANAAARAGGWQLQIVEGPAEVQRTFEVAGLRGDLPFVES